MGAGAIGVTVLIFLYPKMPVARIVGSDIAHAVPLTLIAGAGHWLLGSVNLPLLGSLLVGSIPGIIFGSYFGARVPDRVLRPILAARCRGRRKAGVLNSPLEIRPLIQKDLLTQPQSFRGIETAGRDRNGVAARRLPEELAAARPQKPRRAVGDDRYHLSAGTIARQ